MGDKTEQNIDLVHTSKPITVSFITSKVMKDSHSGSPLSKRHYELYCILTRTSMLDTCD